LFARNESIVADRARGSGRVESVAVSLARSGPVAVRTPGVGHSADIVETSDGRFGSTARRSWYDFT